MKLRPRLTDQEQKALTNFEVWMREEETQERDEHSLTMSHEEFLDLRTAFNKLSMSLYD